MVKKIFLIILVMVFIIPVVVFAYKGTDVPEILPRSTWENSESLKKLLTWIPGDDQSPSEPGDIDPPEYSKVNRIVIHDMGCDVKTKGCNDKQREPVEIIQAIYRYHATTQDWGDIGYHYIIDYWGNIYEGRYGGNGVRGAHIYYSKKCDNFNAGSVGILLMGNYENANLPEEMYASLIKLVGWVANTNSLDVSDLTHYSEIWHSPKKAGKCDTKKGEFSSSYNGPVVVGHNDIEQANSDPGLVDIARVRREAKKLSFNYLFRTKNNSSLYTINNGVLNESSGNKNIVILNESQLNYFPKIYPNSVLIRGPGPEVYLIEDSKKRHIPSPLVFTNKGFKWNDIINVTEQVLILHETGPNLLLNDEALIKGTGPEVYLIKQEKRHWIKTAEVFLGLGYKWNNIAQVSEKELNQYALGPVIASVHNIDVVEEVVEASEEPNIRVGIYSMQTGNNFKITANGPYEIYKNDEFFALKNKDEVFETKADIKDKIRFIPKTIETVFEILSYESRPEWNLKLNDNLFRGIIEVNFSNTSKQIWVVNELKLETYLKGIAEAMDSHSIEYLKTLMVAARSYAYFHINNNGKYPNEIFHIRNWSYDQMYKGYGFESRAPNVVKAAEATKGMLIVFNDKVVRGLYSSDSGGTTRNACELWGQEFCEDDYRYLSGGVKDPAGTIHNSSAVTASHGVGISAIGARKLAEAGKTYQEILKYYYLGINIEKLY